MSSVSPVSAEAPRASLRASPELDLAQLERVVADFSPDLQVARGDVQVADAERQQSRLFNNPDLSAAWGTIPVGKTNPRNLNNPMANVPNYGVTLSYTLPIKKRSARIRSADATHRAREATFLATRRSLALTLASTLADLATATLRAEGVAALADAARRDLEVGQSRLGAGFATPLDVDRLGLEVNRSEQRLASAEADTQSALADCSALLGAKCEPFVDADAARGFLEHWLSSAAAAAPVDLKQRQDLVALNALADAASADADAARAQRIPDPTVSFGYLHDRFIISGNQRNSLNVGVGLSLPVFDHGQAKVAAAESRREALRDERSRRAVAANVAAPALRTQLEHQRARLEDLNKNVVPRARTIVSDLEKAVASRLAAVGDLIQARRALDELLLEQADGYADAFAALLGLASQTGESLGQKPAGTE